MDNPIGPYISQGKLFIDTHTLDTHPDLRMAGIELSVKQKISLAIALLKSVERDE